jgi:hypothetical protein
MSHSWSVVKSFYDRTNFELQTESTVNGIYRLQKLGEQQSLSGQYIEYSEDGTSVTINVELDFSSAVTGVFKTASPEEEDPSHELFSFNLLPQSNITMAPTAVTYLSMSAWHGSLPGSCHLSLHNQHAFILTVYPTDQRENVMVISATKIPNLVEPTFFQNWGNFIMMAGFFIIQMFMRVQATKSAKSDPPPRDIMPKKTK